MKVIKAFPPNWIEIAKVFPVKGVPGILYAYGDRIYNPSGVKITPWIMAHESIHGEQQKDMSSYLSYANQVENWWEKYLLDPGFRLAQELPAHRAEWLEYKHVMHVMGDVSNGYLDLIAKRLSSPLYGNLLSYDEAKERILNGSGSD